MRMLPAVFRMASCLVFATLAAGCARKGLPEEMEGFRPAIEASKLDYVRVKVSKAGATRPWSSKLLGTAYRLKGAEYPRDAAGRPMALLAQINFQEVPPLAGYPRDGILQFFIAAGEGAAVDGAPGHIWGMVTPPDQGYDAESFFRSLREQRNFRVLYHASVITDESRLESTAPAPPSDHLPVFTPARLGFELDTEYVLESDYRFRRVFGKDAWELFEGYGARASDVAQEYFEFTHRPVAAKIGGYASFVQEDPRAGHAEEDWLVLLELRSSIEGGVDMMWGDAGVGAFLIRRADLERRDFSQVAYYWDNH